MIRFDSVSEMNVPWDATVLSIGNFDGVHVGHAALVQELRAMAKRLAVPATVLTFDPHPAAVLDPDTQLVPLSWPDRKARLLKQLGADHVVMLRVDRSFFDMDADRFFDDVLRRRLHVRGMVEGPDFRFGRNRSGDVSRLRELARPQAIEISVVPKVAIDGEVVSSSRIRRLVEAGRVAEANRRLVAPYRIAGTVVPGAGRGASIGFPTANLAAIPNLVPAAGVYAGRVFGLDRVYPAAIHIGPNPTFGDDHLKVEVHLIGWTGSLVGHKLEVDFGRQLRGVIRFDSVDQLTVQLQRDVKAAEAAASDLPLDANERSNHPGGPDGSC